MVRHCRDVGGNRGPMLKWIASWRYVTREKTPDDVAVTERASATVSGKYVLLHKYLKNRHADVVVLTFSQIEDLLGFDLPPLARTDLAWWALRETNVKWPYSDAWTRAGRTATPNLQALTVVFERTPTRRPGLQ